MVDSKVSIECCDEIPFFSTANFDGLELRASRLRVFGDVFGDDGGLGLRELLRRNSLPLGESLGLLAVKGSLSRAFRRVCADGGAPTRGDTAEHPPFTCRRRPAVLASIELGSHRWLHRWLHVLRKKMPSECTIANTSFRPEAAGRTQCVGRFYEKRMRTCFEDHGAMNAFEFAQNLRWKKSSLKRCCGTHWFAAGCGARCLRVVKSAFHSGLVVYAQDCLRQDGVRKVAACLLRHQGPPEAGVRMAVLEARIPVLIVTST